VRRTVSILTVVALSLGAAATPASAAPALRFHGAQYDSPGSDTRSAASLRAEWISLVNTGSRTVNLNGYTIRDKAQHVYTFGNVSIAGNGGRIWVHTGSAADTTHHRYWGSGAYIWNNDGDTAYLRNASGAALDSCAWSYRRNRTWVAC
jgi:hypothetical protein